MRFFLTQLEPLQAHYFKLYYIISLNPHMLAQPAPLDVILGSITHFILVFIEPFDNHNKDPLSFRWWHGSKEWLQKTMKLLGRKGFVLLLGFQQQLLKLANFCVEIEGRIFPSLKIIINITEFFELEGFY